MASAIASRIDSVVRVVEGVGHTGHDLRADGDDNGVVDQADYDDWTANYGNTLVLDDILVG